MGFAPPHTSVTEEVILLASTQVCGYVMAASTQTYLCVPEYLTDIPSVLACTGLVLSSNITQSSMSEIAQAVAAGFPTISAMALDLPDPISSRCWIDEQKTIVW